MPIQLYEEKAGDVLTIHVNGKMDHADYKRLAVDLEKQIQNNPKLHVLFDMTGFHGWEHGTLWHELEIDMKHFDDIERLAMVGDRKWHHAMESFCKPFTLATIRCFDFSEAAEARKWLAEASC